MSRSDVSIGLCEVVCHFEELEDQTMPPRQNFMEYGHSCPSAALRHCRSECCCALQPFDKATVPGQCLGHECPRYRNRSFGSNFMNSATMHLSDFTVCGPPLTILTVGLSRSELQFRLEDGRPALFLRNMAESGGITCRIPTRQMRQIPTRRILTSRPKIG